MRQGETPPPGATDDGQDISGLKLPWPRTSRRDIVEAEQDNIRAARAWLRHARVDLFTEKGLCLLHRKMFGRVWAWAGEYRADSRNIGVPAWRIRHDLPICLNDACYWRDNRTYPAEEIAIRFHHRLVAIHPFANGNGRWSRLAADWASRRLGGASFSWGDLDTGNETANRNRYLAALRAADAHDLRPLMAFALGRP